MSDQPRRVSATELAMTGLALVIFIAAFVESFGFRSVAKWFPMFSSVGGMIVSGALIAGLLLLPMRFKAQGAFDTRADIEQPFGESMRSIAILIAFAVTVALVGMWIAVVLWLPLVFRLFARTSWRTVATSLLGTLIVLVLLTRYLQVDLPPSLLFDVILD